MKEKILKNILYGFFVALVFVLIVFLLKIFNFADFLGDIENKTFDLRQQVTSKYKNHSKDIMILSVDDPSYEYIVSEYGAWPVPRDFWANLAIEIEKYHPRAIIFDLLFVQNFKAFGNSDKMLSEVVNSNNNIYVSMNFDHQLPEVRTPIDLPNSLKTEIEGDVNFLKQSDAINYTNVRGVLNDILNGTDNIGFINILRDKDGIIRSNLPLFRYKNNFYKHLDLLAGLDLLKLGSSKLTVKNQTIYFSDGKKIPLDKQGRAYLNWYGGINTYDYVPVWKADKAIKENDKKFLSSSFRDKIIFVGTAATSLSDVKSVPVSKTYPGVELQATFLNNILDNNFIKKTDTGLNVILTLALVFLTGFIVIRSKSVYKTSFFVILLISIYYLLTLLVMHFFNLWVALVIPVAASIGTITVSYALKYIITSRDYEHTYKLAVTDGLTDLFNHRYFQEQMKINVENSKRYNAPFSLIMVDIDFFKKFNDKYGHQSGDAVLRQVAQTIKKNIRSTDIPCRYGGEEMSVILTNTKKEEAALVAQKICEAVRNKEFELANGSWTHVTISIGVSTMPLDSDSVQGMIEYADKCLYVAKENGRNQVVSTIE